MMYPTRQPMNHRFASTRTGEVEQVLRCFYRAEMPEPWPAAPNVAWAEPKPPQPQRLALGRFFRIPGRVAIAASVALLVIGYLLVQAWFPDPKPESDIGSSTIGYRFVPGKGPDPFHRGPQPGTQKTPGQSPMVLPVHPLPAKK
jgi:hypothetical protein